MTALLVLCALALVAVAAVLVDVLRQHGAVLRRMHELDPDAPDD